VQLHLVRVRVRVSVWGEVSVRYVMVQLHLSAARRHAAGHVGARQRGERRGGGGAAAVSAAVGAECRRPEGDAGLVDAGGDAGEGTEVKLLVGSVRRPDGQQQVVDGVGHVLRLGWIGLQAGMDRAAGWGWIGLRTGCVAWSRWCVPGW
jgi:hypothetical protein